MKTKKIISEEVARKIGTCVGCGDPKSEGAIVCWGCFKYCAVPLKYFVGGFEKWQEVIRAY